MATIVPLETQPAAQPLPQTRGYYMSLNRALSSTSLELEVRRVAEAGFNLLLFPIFNNGWTVFPSESARAWGMPAINPLFRKWNPLAEVAELAVTLGLAVWGFARPYNFHPRFSLAEHKLLKKKPSWRIEPHPDHHNVVTRRYRQWRPCLINREYRRYIGDVLSEGITRYPIDGVVINLSGLGMRGGSLESAPYCFCNQCRKAYALDHEGADLIEAATKRPIEEIRAWQMQKIHQHLIYVRNRVVRAKRSSRVIGRTRPTWRDPASDRNPLHNGNVLMDYPELLASGAIESLVIDHDGEECNEYFSNRIAADYAFLGDRVVFLPMLSISEPSDLACPLRALERYPVPGFIAEFQENLSAEQAQVLRETYFSQPAVLPEAQPIRTAVYLIQQVSTLHADIPVLHDLMKDLLRLLTRQLPVPDDFAILEMIEQNIHGLEQYIRRGRMGGTQIPEMTLRHLGLARRFVRMACMDVRT